MPEGIRKRRAKKQIETATEETPVADSSLPTHVNLSDLCEMRLANAEKRLAEVEKKLAQSQAEAARMARLYALAKLDPKGIILGIEKQRSDAEEAEKRAEKSIESAENKFFIARKRMEATLGRPMQGLAIDPNTGEVTNPG